MRAGLAEGLDFSVTLDGEDFGLGPGFVDGAFCVVVVVLRSVFVVVVDGVTVRPGVFTASELAGGRHLAPLENGRSALAIQVSPNVVGRRIEDMERTHRNVVGRATTAERTQPEQEKPDLFHAVPLCAIAIAGQRIPYRVDELVDLRFRRRPCAHETINIRLDELVEVPAALVQGSGQRFRQAEEHRT